MILPYETIFSRALGKIDDPKELALNSNDFYEIYTERLHNVLGDARIRRLFSSIVLDDEFQEVSFNLVNTIDESSDIEYVCKLFILGITIEWLSPRVDSLNYTIMMVGGKEEKMLNNPYRLLQTRLENVQKELSKTIRDHGYLYNSYINNGI